MNSNEIMVAAIQMNCEVGSKEKNLRKAYNLIKEAAEKGAKLVILPELFNTGYRVEEADMDLAETIPGYTTNWMMDVCQAFNITLVGCILEHGASKGVIFDTAVVTNKSGIVGTYQKIHLWDAENVRFARGKEWPVFQLEWGKIGLQICYEVGFPEGARVLASKGADILIYPSAFGKARLYAWDLATKSRALENGCFVIAANRSGIEKGETEFGGHSRITCPSGEVLTEAIEDDEVIVATINLEQVVRQRRNIPYLRDLNKDLVVRELSSL